MNRRLLITRHWAAGRRNGVPLRDLVRECLAPTCEVRAARVTESRREEGELVALELRGLPPLWVPADFDHHQLCTVIAEQFAPEHWHYFDTPETPLTADDVVADCGAAEGLFTLIASRRCRHVFAAEPLPSFQRALARTFAAAPNVTILPFALSDAPADAWITDDGVASRIVDHETPLPARITTLDELYTTHPDFRPTYIKADIEGFEPRLIRGGRRMIAALKPKIAITTYHEPGHAAELQAALRALRPDYRFRVKGIEHQWGEPVMLHAY